MLVDMNLFKPWLFRQFLRWELRLRVQGMLTQFHMSPRFLSSEARMAAP